MGKFWRKNKMKTIVAIAVSFLITTPAISADYDNYEMGSWMYSQDESACEKARRDHARALDYRETVSAEGAVRYAEGLIERAKHDMARECQVAVN